MNTKRISYSVLVIEIALLLIVTTINYLPNLRKATIYRDDWYYMVDRMIGGPQTFHFMFSIDRPARGYFFEAYYRLFGVEPQPYHMAAYVWHLLTAAATFWLFTIIWPKNRPAVLLIALLFILYPGYTRWMEGIEDQPKMVSSFLMVVSFALTLKAISTRRWLPRIIYWTGSILTGWGYVLLIDYAMGMEIFRFLCAFVYVDHLQRQNPWLKKGIAALKAAWPGVLVLGAYLFWRVFIFKNVRPETDIKLQLSKVIESPFQGLSYWFSHLLQSLINEAVVAWGGYDIQAFFRLNYVQFYTGLITALVITAAVVGAFYWINRRNAGSPNGIMANPGEITAEDGTTWQVEAIWIGSIGVLAGVLPVVLANRAAEFGILSHYMAPASLAAATLLGGLIGSITSNHLRLASIGVVMLLAVMTHYTASIKVVNEEQILSNFWHQVAWRAPGIREATSLLVNYPGVTIGEDVDYVHGPANFIYYPQPVTDGEMPIRYKLFAIKQYPWTVSEFLAGGKVRDGYRTHYGIIDYGYVLVITQPTVDACVHIVDRRWPWFSFNELNADMIVGQHSNIKNVRTNVPAPQLSETIFGPEPEHGWCYYFEKADLAFQQNDLKTTAALGDEATRLKLTPSEPLEWMPFMQAAAMLGDEKTFTAILEKLTQVEYNRVQTCNVLSDMQSAGITLQPNIVRVIQQKACPIEN